jgi:hypothetical protein
MRCDTCYSLLKSWSDALNEYAFRVSELKYTDPRQYSKFYDGAASAFELTAKAKATYDAHREEHAIGVENQTVPDRSSTMSLTNSDRPPNKGQNPNYPKNGHAEHPQELGVADIKEDRQRQGIGTSQARTPPDQATG